MTAVIAASVIVSSCGPGRVSDFTPTDTAAEIYPDYAGVTLPVNISPLNFYIVLPDNAVDSQAWIGIEGEEPEMVISGPSIEMDVDKWHELLTKAAGRNIYFRVFTLQDGLWLRHPDILNSVSTDAIDCYMAYRLIYPGYELWNRVGIYQRNLTNFDQTPIMENKDFDKNCTNCHSFAANSPDTMMLHVRGSHGGTLVSKGGVVKKHKPKHPDLPNNATYPTWHPEGRFIIFSTNNVGQAFHTSGYKPIEVFDMSADLMVFDTETGETYTDGSVATDSLCETFPVWCPGTDEIYFCRARNFNGVNELKQMRYDLWATTFNRDSKTWGEPRPVYEASADSMSVSFPRFSPDGRYLLFTRSGYGNFSIWHPESQLVIIDTATGQMRELDELNSDDVESYHSWSSDGRWVAFSSKRIDGTTARPFIASFDPATGKFGKPFVLPQQNPLFYDDFSLTFNIPELIKGPVTNAPALLDATLNQ